MKELSVEEKAKRYDGAIQRVNNILEGKCNVFVYYHHNQGLIDYLFPELKESDGEKIKKELIDFVKSRLAGFPQCEKFIAWLEKQGEQKPTQEINPFKAEHGKYYYCIKDYFCGGRKQASKGDIVQALRGLPIMGLKDASEFFLPVNFIKCNSGWSEEDEKMLDTVIEDITKLAESKVCYYKDVEWLKSLKERHTWKPSDEQMEALKFVIESLDNMFTAIGYMDNYTKPRLEEVLAALKKLKGNKDVVLK